MENPSSNTEVSESLFVVKEAAKILGLDYRTLVAFYNPDYYEEVEDDPEIGPQLDKLYKYVYMSLDPTYRDLATRMKRVADMLSGFKDKVDELTVTYFIEYELHGAKGSFLTEETAQAALELIRRSPKLQELYYRQMDDTELVELCREKIIIDFPLNRRVFELIEE